MSAISPEELAAAITKLRSDLTQSLEDVARTLNDHVEKLRHDLTMNATSKAQEWEDRHNDNLTKIAAHVTDLKSDLYATVRNSANEQLAKQTELADNLRGWITELRGELHQAFNARCTTHEQAVSTGLESATRYNEKARSNDTRMLLDKLEALQGFIEQEHVTAFERAQASSALFASATLCVSMLLEALDQIGAPTAAEVRQGPH